MRLVIWPIHFQQTLTGQKRMIIFRHFWTNSLFGGFSLSLSRECSFVLFFLSRCTRKIQLSIHFHVSTPSNFYPLTFLWVCTYIFEEEKLRLVFQLEISTNGKMSLAQPNIIRIGLPQWKRKVYVQVNKDEFWAFTLK